METSAIEFGAKWYVVERAVIDAAAASFFHGYAIALAKGRTIALGDAQVADAPVAYGDPHLDALLERVRGRVEQATGFALWPTYSYLRLYKRGNLLKAHRDRPACEISMTVNLGMSGDEPWPIWIAGPQGIASVSLNPGDGLIYRGCDCYHWREPFQGNHLAQVFLHYVDQNGPNAEWKYDKRPRLSTPPDENQSVRSPQGVVVVDDFLRPSTFAELSQCISNKPLLYGSRSNPRTDPHGHWSWNFVTAGPLNLSDVSGDLEENAEAGPVHSAWKFLRDTRLENDLLIRCYLSAYTYGTDGYFHADSERPDEHTTIVYMNDYWEPDWAGETVFLDTDGEVVKSVLPRANRAVIFPSRVQHAGRSVSRKCTVLRKALIFKSRSRRSIEFEKLSSFLRHVGAVNYGHESGTLHDHLVRTFSILETKGFDSTVCFGGGLHSIYGTNVYRHCVLTPSDQAKIVDEFGPRAEELVRLFSELDRPRTLESPLDLKSDSAVVELRSGRTLVLDRQSFDDLRKIECANQMDQDSLAQYSALLEFWKAADCGRNTVSETGRVEGTR
jgi:hypothetical protein